MIFIITSFVSVWVAASIVAMGLILFRSDAYEVWEDIVGYTRKRKAVLKLLSVILLLCVLPFSIPYSISNIIKRK
jgi:hypothetical protein